MTPGREISEDGDARNRPARPRDDTANADANGLLVHGSAVALGERAVLMTGASGSGKSALALQLMAYGCTLICDDQVLLKPAPQGLLACAPQGAGRGIEARRVGILQSSCIADRADAGDVARGIPLVLCVDLDKPERDRLPPHRTITFLGKRIAKLHAVESGYFAAAILQYVKGGRSD
ncbi:HPr kinase/phosphorylase [Brevirhabdus sp.]|uniref:HPr kinase/phosphorylase n=1 Tax=Brevirhabdus sp. TaxID=2004514 RepID=UPI004058A04D